MTRKEWARMVQVLLQYPELHLILDEAYAEMSFVPMTPVLRDAGDLKKRIILLRSATKALSAAGERMAMLIVFDEVIMNELLNKNINYFIHAPRSAQMAYTHTMLHFNEEMQKQLADYYRDKVQYVVNRLRALGAAMPDASYTVQATFYVLADFSDLLGLKLGQKAAEVLQQEGKDLR